jgi:uncharacterized protein
MASDSAENSQPPSAGDPILGELVRRLIEVYHSLRIYLFGSAARGDEGPDSDYDLMVVVADGTLAELRDSSRAYHAIWRLGAAADVLVWTRAEFDGRLPHRASLPATIVCEGRLLDAA